MELVAVAAMTPERVIATAEGVPWDFPEDVKQYKRRVQDEPVIVGRETYEAMAPNPPGAHQIVLSRSERSSDSPTTTFTTTASEGLAIAEKLSTETAYVIGGGEIYSLYLDEYNRMVVTVVDYDVSPEKDGLVYFPKWDRTRWEKTATEDSYSGFTIEYWT